MLRMEENPIISQVLVMPFTKDTTKRRAAQKTPLVASSSLSHEGVSETLPSDDIDGDEVIVVNVEYPLASKNSTISDQASMDNRKQMYQLPPSNNNNNNRTAQSFDLNCEFTSSSSILTNSVKAVSSIINVSPKSSLSSKYCSSPSLDFRDRSIINENSLSDISPTITPVSLIDSVTYGIGLDKNTSHMHSSMLFDNKITNQNTGCIASAPSQHRQLPRLVTRHKIGGANSNVVITKSCDVSKVSTSFQKHNSSQEFHEGMDNSLKIVMGHNSPIIHASVSSNKQEEVSLQTLHCSDSSDFNIQHQGHSAANVLLSNQSFYSSSLQKHSSSNSILASSNSALDELSFSDPFPHISDHVRLQSRSPNTPIGLSSSKNQDCTRSTKHNSDSGGSNSNIHCIERNDNLLMSGSQLLSDSVDLNFLPDSQILSSLPIHEIPTDSVKGVGEHLRPEDMFLTGLPPPDHDLLPSTLTNAINSPVNVSEASNSVSNLPELPPSPILENMSPDFLGSGSSISKGTLPNSVHSTSFLSNIPTNTENLALTFSANFLENSNLSIDIGSLSEGEACSRESAEINSLGKRSSGNELNFTNALKNATGRSSVELIKPDRTTSAMCAQTSLSPSYCMADFKDSSINQLLMSSPTDDVFKVPSQAKQAFNNDSLSSLSSVVRRSNSFSSKEYKIDSNRKHQTSHEVKLGQKSSTKSPVKPVPFFQEVSCLKCQLCSYLTLDKSDISEHMKEKHNEVYLQSLTLENEKGNNLETQQPTTDYLTPKTSEFSSDVKTKNNYNDTKSLDSLPKTRKRKIVSKTSSKKRATQNHTPQSYAPSQQTNKEALAIESITSRNSSMSQDIEEENRTPSKGRQTKSSSQQDSTPSHDEKNELSKTYQSSTTSNKSVKYQKSNGGQEKFGIRCGVDGCGFRMKSEKNMSYHRSCHRDAFFICPECKLKTSNWSTLSIHLWRHHLIDMELYKCEKCSYKSYSYMALMNGHWKSHSTERPFLCDVCGKDFKTSKQLRNHKTLHVQKRDEFKHNCSMCQRKFAERRMLRLHLEAVHKKVKPFLCNYCGNSFASKSTLNLHIRKHTGEMPFSCESCSYRSSDHNSMRRHKMKHTNERPYSCPYCDYSSIQSSTYKVHLRRKHEEQAIKDEFLFACSLCPFKTVKKDNFLAHVGTRHPCDQTKSTIVHRKTNSNRGEKVIAGKKSSKIVSAVPTTPQVLPLGSVKQNTSTTTLDSTFADNISASLVTQDNLSLQHFSSPKPVTSTSTSSIVSSSHIYSSLPQLTTSSLAEVSKTNQFTSIIQRDPVIIPTSQNQSSVICKNKCFTGVPTATSLGSNQLYNMPCSSTVLVANSKKDDLPPISQPQTLYVYGELMPVNRQYFQASNDTFRVENQNFETDGKSNENGFVFTSNSIFTPVIFERENENSGSKSATHASDSTIIQAMNIGDGVFQLTPEVVAMPVDTSLGPNGPHQPELISCVSPTSAGPIILMGGAPDTDLDAIGD